MRWLSRLRAWIAPWVARNWIDDDPYQDVAFMSEGYIYNYPPSRSHASRRLEQATRIVWASSDKEAIAILLARAVPRTVAKEQP